MSEEKTPTLNSPDFHLLCNRFLNAIPHSQTLGMQIVHAVRNRVIIKMPWRYEMVGNSQTGALAGGVITTLLDTVCGSAVLCALPKPEAFATLDLRIDHMKPSEGHRDIFCMAECYRLTNSIAFVRGVAYQDDPQKPIAHGVASFMRASSSNGNMVKTRQQPQKQPDEAPTATLNKAPELKQ